MSKITAHDMPQMAGKAAARLVQKLHAQKNYQGAAANLAGSAIWQADHDGQIGDAEVLLGTASAAGESMTVDILKNGTSIMTGGTPVTIAASSAKGSYDLWSAIDPAKRGYVVGDLFTCSRVYTAGGTPTPMKDTTVIIEPCPTPFTPTRV